jgi:hypothetical protein
MHTLPFPLPKNIEEKVKTLTPQKKETFYKKLEKSVIWMSRNWGYPNIPELAELRYNEVLQAS